MFVLISSGTLEEAETATVFIAFLNQNEGYEMLCVIVLGLFSLLNDVTLTIQIMTLKIVTNIINLRSHGFPHFAFVSWLVTHIVMLLVLPSLSSLQ